MSQSRQLAAIMFTDIVGYTAMMGEDEQKAFEILRKNRQLQKPIIEKYGGRWIKELGDGVLASFSTATDAVLSAGEIQKACENIDNLKLRIGIHIGEVVFEDNDVFGDGVNIASRIQTLAPIGGIWITEAVHKNVVNKKGINSFFIREEALKNVKESVRVYEVKIDSKEAEHLKQTYIHDEPAQTVAQKKFKPPAKEKTSPALQIKTKEKKKIQRRILAGTIIVIILTLIGFIFIPRRMKIQKARNEWITEIQKLADDSYTPSTKAFDLAKEAEKYIPKDSALLKLWPAIAGIFTFQTEPAGADVYWKDYSDTKQDWKLLGKTPLKNIWIPQGFSRIKIEKPGFITVLSPATQWQSELTLILDSAGSLPENMVKVKSSESQDNIIGLEKYKGKSINDYLIDKHEVTNKEYKRFVDAGGYSNKTYWNDTIIYEDKEISWEKAMLLFIDKTGKPGPAGWEVGTYPDGKENHPVTGISWYEAMAYAKFAGKKLPTVYHWSLVADTWNASDIIQKSNFNGTGTVPVGTLDGVSFWGVYDIAGNAREWCFNEGNRGQRFILGAGWNDAPEDYSRGISQSPIDRSLSNGFRCIKELPGDTTYDELSDTVNVDFRDYNKEKPVNNETFDIFLRQYAYDSSALNSKVTTVSDSGFWRLEKIEVDAAYNKERLTAYLFIPKNTKPPYQTILFFPGSSVFLERDFIKDKWWRERVFDFVLKSGRAVLFPVIKGSFERGSEERLVLVPEESILYKNQMVFWTQDVGRSIDYLGTRNDIVHDNFGFFSFSWGSTVAPIVCAVEKRIRAAVFHAPGFMMQRMLPEADPLNFLPRVQIPVLMLNGENDAAFPLEATRNPMYNLLGSLEKDKNMLTYPGGHLVPRTELMKESLFWFDKYLGPVK